jgi:hypothetical protein
MDFEIIENDTVRSIVESLHNRSSLRFEQLLANDAVLIHNGQPEDIREWARLFFFEGQTHFLSISRTEDDGCLIFAELESPVAGKIAVKLAFTLSGNKLTVLNAGRP